MLNARHYMSKAGTGGELRTALDGIYAGKILAEAVDAGEREPAKK